MSHPRNLIRSRLEQLVPRLMETSDSNPAGLRAAGLMACSYLCDTIDFIDKAEARYVAKDGELRALIRRYLEEQDSGELTAEMGNDLRARIRAHLGEGAE